MNRDTYEPYEPEEAPAETWHCLQEAQMLLDGTKSTVPFYSERVAETIGQMQAYRRVLRRGREAKV